MAALNVLAVMIQTGVKLSELSRIIEDVPQVLINLRVKKRKDLDSIPGYLSLVKKVTQSLGDNGRVFVRFSGTEPVVRVLVEGPDRIQINQFAGEIAELLENELQKE